MNCLPDPACVCMISYPLIISPCNDEITYDNTRSCNTRDDSFTIAKPVSCESEL